MVNMEAEWACVVCNWVSDAFWPWGPLGAFGAAGAGFFGGGFFGGSGPSGRDEPGRNAGDNDGSGADQTQSESDYRNSVIKPPRPGEPWPTEGRNTRDAFRWQQFGEGEAWDPRILDAADGARRWSQWMLGLDPNNPDGRGSAPAGGKA